MDTRNYNQDDYIQNLDYIQSISLNIPSADQFAQHRFDKDN